MIAATKATTHVSHIYNISNLGPLEGTHASKSDTIGSKKGGSFALESDGIIEFGVKTIDEDAGSIKDVENNKLDVMKEDVEDGDNKATPEVQPPLLIPLYHMPPIR